MAMKSKIFKITFLSLLIIFFSINSSKASNSEEFMFAKAVIESYRCNLIAIEKINTKKESKDDMFINYLNTLIALRGAISWQEKAILEIKPYLKNNNELIRKIAEVNILGNNLIIDAFSKDIDLIERILNNETNNSKSQMGTILNELSQGIDNTNKGWEMILMSASGVAHVLWKQQGTLKITAEEKKELLKKLNSIGIKSGPKAGQKPIEIAPRLIWEFLNEPWKTIDSN